MFFATLVIAASLALPLTNQYERPSVSQPELSSSQIEELDKEGALLDPAAFRKPPLDCTRPQTDTETPVPTHILKLKDGRTLKGRLDSTATDRTIKFTVIVGSIQQPMSFNRGDIKSIELIGDE